MSEELRCPHCAAEIDIDKKLEIGLYSKMEDGDHEAACDICKKDFIVESAWHPMFRSMTIEEREDS